MQTQSAGKTLSENARLFWTAMIYLIVASGWIFFSDELVRALFGSQSEGADLNRIKVAGFLILTGIWLLLVLRHSFHGAGLFV